MLLGLGFLKLSTFKKTYGSEHEFKPKHKWSGHTLMHVKGPSTMQLIITSALLGKILWWYCWTKVDYIESISRLLSILKDKMPVFFTCLLPKKRRSDNDFRRLIDFGRRVSGTSLLYSNTETS
jgi:hypothetical protein